MISIYLISLYNALTLEHKTKDMMKSSRSSSFHDFFVLHCFVLCLIFNTSSFVFILSYYTNLFTFVSSIHYSFRNVKENEKVSKEKEYKRIFSFSVKSQIIRLNAFCDFTSTVPHIYCVFAFVCFE